MIMMRCDKTCVMDLHNMFLLSNFRSPNVGA